MLLTKQISELFRAAYFGGNWTAVNLKDSLEGVNWQQATTSVHNLNTIAVLVFHINYYVHVVLDVLKGSPLIANDKFSFDIMPITSEAEWQKLITKTLTEAEWFAEQIEKLGEATLFEDFSDPKYGNYYRNLHGIIEHTHYHLGQISLIKKMLNEANQTK